MKKVDIDEWIVHLLQAMYNYACSGVRVSSEYSEDFEVNVGVLQGSVPSPLLFIIVLGALSRDFRVSMPGELFFADDVLIIATFLEECIEREIWKESLESKGHCVNMKKTMVMAPGLKLDVLHDQSIKSGFVFIMERVRIPQSGMLRLRVGLDMSCCPLMSLTV